MKTCKLLVPHHILLPLLCVEQRAFADNADMGGLRMYRKIYLLAQVLEQNLFDPLNWLAGARLPQYSHFNTEEENEDVNINHTHSFMV